MKGSREPSCGSDIGAPAESTAGQIGIFDARKAGSPCGAADEGFGRQDRQCAAPIESADKPQEGQARWMGGPSEPDSALLVECELFAQEEILGRERPFSS